jgi:hypothetical protein
MRFRTLTLALALSLGTGAVATVHAADQTRIAKQRHKELKKLNKERTKNSNAARYSKTRKAKDKKIKHG